MNTIHQYTRPLTVLVRIRPESGICSGSVAVMNPQGELGEIEAQKVNNDFSADFSSGSEWDSTSFQEQ